MYTYTTIVPNYRDRPLFAFVLLLAARIVKEDFVQPFEDKMALKAYIFLQTMEDKMRVSSGYNRLIMIHLFL